MRLNYRFGAGFMAWIILRVSTALQSAETGAVDQLQLSSPVDYQVQQRSSRDEGTITVAGALPRPVGHQVTLEARQGGGAAPAEWTRLAVIEPMETGFHAEFRLPAGGWFRLETRVRNDELVVAEATVEHVGVGEVFVIAGQSNAANHGEERQTTSTGLVASYFDGKWQPANDPQAGASGGGGSFIPPFGDAMAERFNVPIGIIATAVGATSVREWLPRGTRFPNPPTLTGRVNQLENGEWESKGTLFGNLATRVRQAGPRGFRSVLWHQGESDANQQDTTRTLPGALYQNLLEQLIRDSRREAGWEIPWFVAQASYHTPDDPGSPEIRSAQSALWKSGTALEGPDSDALTGDLRDSDGKGVHFSGQGLREHGVRWAEKVAPWLERQLATASPTAASGPIRLALPDSDDFTVNGRPAFLFLPALNNRTIPQPWIFYAPTLPGLPDEAERWMHEQFLAAGIAVAGVDVGEAHGNPQSLAVFDALYRELTEHRGFAGKPCLLGRSRGGLWMTSWAIAHPGRVAGIAGIYPVFDFRSYPGIEKAAAAYGFTSAEFEARADEFNPVARVGELAGARIPVILIHGDSDTVVPLEANSAEFVRRYHEAGAGSLAQLMVLEGQGHNYFEGFFHSQAVVDFVIARAREGAGADR